MKISVVSVFSFCAIMTPGEIAAASLHKLEIPTPNDTREEAWLKLVLNSGSGVDF